MPEQEQSHLEREELMSRVGGWLLRLKTLHEEGKLGFEVGHFDVDMLSSGIYEIFDEYHKFFEKLGFNEPEDWLLATEADFAKAVSSYDKQQAEVLFSEVQALEANLKSYWSNEISEHETKSFKQSADDKELIGMFRNRAAVVSVPLQIKKHFG